MPPAGFLFEPCFFGLPSQHPCEGVSFQELMRLLIPLRSGFVSTTAGLRCSFLFTFEDLIFIYQRAFFVFPASLIAIATACLRFVTFGPFFAPECSSPCLYSCMTFFTFLSDFFMVCKLFSCFPIKFYARHSRCLLRQCLQQDYT